MILYQHEKEGIEFLKNTTRAILADEMGLGKTIQAITAVKLITQQAVIVVCPASIKTNWEREIKAACPWDDITIMNGRKNAPQGNQEVKNWVIINYDILEAHLPWITQTARIGKIGALILDESHYIKGKSRRAKAAVELSKHIDRVYCLTGTPLMNRPIELWNQLVAIQHPMTQEKGARSHYARRFCGAFLQTITTRNGVIHFMNEQGATNLDDLRKELKGYMLRRKKKDVLDLPAKTIDVMEVELTPEQRREYDSAWEVYLDFLEHNPPQESSLDNIIAARQLVEIQKLKQVCSHAKIDRIVSDAENMIEQDEKIIIFTQYKATLEMLIEKLKQIKIETDETDYFGNPKKKPIKVVQLSGANDMAERQQAVDDFQNDPDVKVFVANIKAAGVGINLTKASIVIFADMEWTPEIHSQAEDRAHRIGQTGTVNVHYYVAKETIEEDIIELLAKKKQIVQEVIDGTKQRISTKSVLAEFTKRMSDKVINLR